MSREGKGADILTTVFGDDSDSDGESVDQEFEETRKLVQQQQPEDDDLEDSQQDEKLEIVELQIISSQQASEQRFAELGSPAIGSLLYVQTEEHKSTHYKMGIIPVEVEEVFSEQQMPKLKVNGKQDTQFSEEYEVVDPALLTYEEAVHECAEIGKWDQAWQLIQEGDYIDKINDFRPHVSYEQGRTLLMRASEQAEIEEVKKMIEIPGIDINKTCMSGTALMLAVKKSRRGLRMEMSKPDEELDKNSHQIFHLLAEKCRIGFFEELGFGVIHVAAEAGDLQAVKHCIEHNVDIDSTTVNGSTALILAGSNGHLDVMDYLIEQKADVNVVNLEGDTVLTLCDDQKAIRKLVDLGMNINHQNNEDLTMLMKAAARPGHKHFVQFLIEECDANPNKTDMMERRALNFAADKRTAMYLKEKSKKLSWRFMKRWIGVILSFVDVTSDIILIATFIKKGEEIWAGLALGFVLLSTTVGITLAASLLKDSKNFSLWKFFVTIILGILQLNIIVGAFWSESTYNTDSLSHVEEFVRKAKIVETLTEALPQSLLTCYIVLTGSQRTWVTYLSVFASLFSASWTCSQGYIFHYHPYYKRLWRRIRRRTELITFVWSIFDIGTRIISLSFVFAAYRLYGVLIFIPMIAWRIYYSRNFPSRWGRSYPKRRIRRVMRVFEEGVLYLLSDLVRLVASDGPPPSKDEKYGGNKIPNFGSNWIVIHIISIAESLLMVYISIYYEIPKAPDECDFRTCIDAGEEERRYYLQNNDATSPSSAGVMITIGHMMKILIASLFYYQIRKRLKSPKFVYMRAPNPTEKTRWLGWYIHKGKRYPMANVLMSLRKGLILGHGKDIVGPFTLEGTYTRFPARVRITKQYLHKKYNYEGVLSTNHKVIEGEWISYDRSDGKERGRDEFRLEKQDMSEISKKRLKQLKADEKRKSVISV